MPTASEERPRSDRIRRGRRHDPLPGIAFWVALGLVVGAPGCTIVHRSDTDRLTARDLEALPGLATKREVLERIGPPSDMELRIDGSAFHYRAETQRGSGVELNAFQASFESSDLARTEELLIVVFDKEGRVVHYGFARDGSDGGVPAR